MDSVIIHKGGQVILTVLFTNCDLQLMFLRERNHEFIRYIIPKNKGKDTYTAEEIRTMMNHINSYPRKKWNGQAPIDLFRQIYGEETATLLGLEKIPSGSIKLTPALLK